MGSRRQSRRRAAVRARSCAATRVATAVLVGGCLATAPARAERDLHERQGDDWYATQAALLGGSTLVNAVALVAWQPQRPRVDAALRWERGTERNFAPGTSRASDATLVTSLVLPSATLPAYSGSGAGNALLVYFEALEASLLLQTVTKKSVARARPYTHLPQGAELAAASHGDAYCSFYSGHSALSFAGATAGSFLFAALGDDLGPRTIHWVSTFTLASFTAHARVRAGRHYPTDVLVGSAMGIAGGVAVPLLQGVRPELAPAEVVGAVGGITGGTALALALPRRTRAHAATVDLQIVPRAGGLLISLATVLP